MTAEEKNVETLRVLVEGLNDKFKIMMDEAEKRNGQRFDAQQEAVATAMTAAEKAVVAAMAAAEKAVTKAEAAAEKRFESVNEFRKTLSDQTNSFLTRNEYAAQHAALVEKVDALLIRMLGMDKKVDGIQERGFGRNDTWVILATVVALLISVASVVVHLYK
jgi:hypothetical protein